MIFYCSRVASYKRIEQKKRNSTWMIFTLLFMLSDVIGAAQITGIWRKFVFKVYSGSALTLTRYPYHHTWCGKRNGSGKGFLSGIVESVVGAQSGQRGF